MEKFRGISYVGFLFILTACTTQNKKQMDLYQNEPILVSSQFSFTEGPSSDKNGNIYFTDQPNDRIYLWDWKTNEINLFMQNTGRANGTDFDSQNNLITASDLNGEIWKIDQNKNIQILSKGFEDLRFNGPNDLWIDEFGGIYFTDPLYKRDYWEVGTKGIAERNLYYRNRNGKVTKLETFIQPNGIVGSVTLKKLYVSDFGANKTFVYDILDEGKLSEKKLFCQRGSDGMTLDVEENVYLTGNGVTIYNKNGEKLYNIPIPEKWTANVTFGGKKNSTLFITAKKSVYILEMNVSGIR